MVMVAAKSHKMASVLCLFLQPKRELKRARIQILLKRTAQYVSFLAANPKNDSSDREDGGDA